MPPKSKQTSDAAAWFKSVVVTRKTNKDAHPGQIVHAMEEKKQVEEENLRAAAAIEDKLCCEDIEHNAP
ncbi:hypothetical protein CPB84DRAFT_1851761 [Gymnopilus junonius]|uniref:Uncharacterized protein n=1 Tax=Gymnopilus junonius TaxID=109634 RepID=A0A9P5NFR7_GYMJU|nr:hypothetical protein CPB84DRAFT_1851761 [Gymnopilus junonius]